MKFIREIQLVGVDDELSYIYENIVTARITIDYLSEEVDVPTVPSDLIDKLSKIMDDAVSKYSAARRALSIVGKLKPGEERQKHTKTILSNLNKLRAYNQRIDGAVKKLSVREDNEVEFENILTEMKTEFTDLDKFAQKVWTAKGDAKKTALITMINKFKFKGQQEKHLAKAEAMNNPNQIDKFAADLMQVGHGNKVI